MGYFVSHKICFPQRFFFWQSAGAVILAAGAHYLLISLLASLIWKQNEITSIILFFIGILPSLPFYFFFYGLFGGWDDGTLAELKQAIDLTGFLRPFAHAMIYLPNLWGDKNQPASQPLSDHHPRGSAGRGQVADGGEGQAGKRENGLSQ